MNEYERTVMQQLRKAHRELHEAYMRIRALVGAWDTNHGGENRFAVTEAKVKELLDIKSMYEELQK